MSDAHSHDHAGHNSGGHAGHAHGVSADANTGKVAIALGLILGFVVVEVVTGVVAHSLALLSDAGHMLTDAAAIAFSLIAMKLAARPAKGALTYGPQTRRDPLRPGQRRHPAHPRRVHQLRSDPSPG